MWDKMKQQRLNELQRRELESALSDEERRRLEELLYELEQEEWQMLNPSLERLRGEQAALHQNISETNTQHAILSAIASRQDDLLKRAKVQLTAMRSEYEALRAERERVLNKSVA